MPESCKISFNFVFCFRYCFLIVCWWMLEVTDLEKHANRIIGVVKIKKSIYSETFPKKCEKESRNGAKMDSKSISESDANPYRCLNTFLMDFGSQMAPKMEPEATNKSRNKVIKSRSRRQGHPRPHFGWFLDNFWMDSGWFLDDFSLVLDGCWMILLWFLDAGRFLLLAFVCFHTHVFGCSKVSAVSRKS